MAQASDAVWLPVLPSMKDFGPALIKGAGSEADKAGGSIGKKLGGAMVIGATAAVGAVSAAGAALYKVGAVFDDVADTIRVGTGASGKALDGLVDTAKKIGTRVPADFEKIGPTVADLNTRLGLSGDTLETVASQYLEAGRILGQDVDINATSAAFSAFGIAGADVEGAMDALFRTSQATGVGMNELAGIVQKSAPAMQTLGFSFEETAALAGTLDKAGLNTQQVMNSMSKGLVTLAKDGEKPQDAFKRTVGEIEGFIKAGDQAGAINLASKVFGTKGATQFIGALQDGKVNLDDLVASAGMTDDTILGLGQETADFAEQWQLFKNRVLVWLEPMGSKVFGAMGTAMAEVNGAVLAFGEAFKAADGDITSSGLAGFFEQLGYLTSQVWAGLTMDASTRASFNGQLSGFVAFGAGLRDVFDSVKAVAGPFFASLGAVFAGLAPVFASLGPQVLQLVMAFSPLGLIFKALTPVLPQIVGLVQTLGNALSGALASVLPVVTGLIGTLVGLLSGVFMQMMPIVTQLVEALASTIAQLFPVITRVIEAVVPLVTALISQLAPVIVNLVSSILPPVIDLFMQIVSAIAPLVEMILAILVPAIQFLMPIVQVAFNVIATVVKVALGVVIGILSGVVGFIKNVLVPVITWLWQNIVQPYFTAIGNVISWVWNNVISPAFSAISWYINNVLAPVIGWLWKTIIQPAFDGIGATIKWVWENVIKPVFDFLADAIQNKIPDAFEKGKKFVEDIWKGIQDVVKAPIRFVVETVLNKGLIGAFNTVADFLHIGKIDPIGLPQGFANGGYTGPGGKYQPAGIVHAGEFVFTKEQTRRAGVSNLYAMARALTGYAAGGFVDPLRGGLAVTQGYNRVHKGIDFAAAVGTPVYAANTGVVTWAGPGVQAPGVWGGNEVHILGNGIETWYAHLSQIGVKLGELVKAGQQVALSGNTGISSGPHLHFGAFQGGWPNDIDPMAFLSGAQADGKPFNPIAGIIDGLMGKFKEAFPGGGFVVDLVGGFAKNLLEKAADAVMNLVGGNSDKKGSAVGDVPYLLRDQGGILPEGLSAVLNKTGSPEWVLNRSQIDTLDRALLSRGNGGLTINGNVGWDPEEVAQRIETKRRDSYAAFGI